MRKFQVQYLTKSNELLNRVIEAPTRQQAKIKVSKEDPAMQIVLAVYLKLEYQY